MRKPQECTTIDQIRSEIDRIDRAMIEAIAERQAYVHAIMRFKQNGDDVRAPGRQQEVIESRRAWAEAVGVDPKLIDSLFRTIIDHFIETELALLEEDDGI